MLASRFIARKDVKAVQHADGSWAPHTHDGRVDGNKLPWKRSDFVDHLSKKQTFGHYLLNADNECKLFAFDIDLEKNKPETHSTPYQGRWVDIETGEVHEFDAREAWQQRGHPSRNWSKYQLKMVASRLIGEISDLGIPCAAAYSGGKGVHVYGFTGLMSAADAREGATIAIESLNADATDKGWSASRGNNFYRSDDQDPVTGFPNLTIEIFPKQDKISEGGLGNLMRLPLGKNQKSSDPTFFLDMTSPMAQMVPIDPIWAMTATTPWKSPND